MLVCVSPVSLEPVGAPVAQWVKHWPSDLVVVSLSPAAGGEILSAVNGVSFHSLSLSISHPPDMTEILLKMLLNRKSSIHSS